MFTNTNFVKGDRRLGKFFVSNQTINEEPNKAVEIFEEMIVLHVDYCFGRNGFVYTALSEKFSLVPVGQEPPMYKVNRDRKGQVFFDI